MRYFLADTHFGHENLILKMGRKGFTNVEEHDAAVLDAINTTVDVRDELVLLGDFGWSASPGKYRQMIRCKHIVFIRGNHDKHDACLRTFGTLHDIKEFKMPNKQTAVCAHYPLAYWNRSHYGSYHLYGHMHGQREETLDLMFPDRRSMDVGVDVAMKHFGRPTPFSENWIVEYMESKPGHDPVSFYRGSES